MNVFEQNQTPDQLRTYQRAALAAQLEYAAEKSPFYRRLLAGADTARAELSSLPFTSAVDIAAHGPEMACLPASDVRRIVTLSTSGSCGPSKRILFSDADIEATSAFFAAGMRYMCAPGDRVLILLSGDTPDGLGRLLAAGLERFGAIPLLYGGVSDFDDAARRCLDFMPHTVVGAPASVRRLALTTPGLRPVNALLSSDYVSEACVQTIRRLWQCNAFTHYGMTETGYGCAVECPAHNGQHIRNDELMLEIVEPDGDTPAPPGKPGEIVITTLRREAMPLIRYRTGDMGVLLDSPCACGSTHARLGRVYGRLDELRHKVNIYKLDEYLLRQDAILDYNAALCGGRLDVALDTAAPAAARYIRDLLRARLPGLKISVSAISGISSVGKRSITRV